MNKTIITQSAEESKAVRPFYCPDAIKIDIGLPLRLIYCIIASMENSKVSFDFLRSLRKAPASLKAALYVTAAILLGAAVLSFPSFHCPGSYPFSDFLTLSICAVCLYGAVPADILTSSGLAVVFVLMLFSGIIYARLSAGSFFTLLSEKEDAVVRPLRLYGSLLFCLICCALLFSAAFCFAYGPVPGALGSAFMAVSVFFGCGLSLLEQGPAEVFSHVLIYDLAVAVSSALGGCGGFLLSDTPGEDRKQGTVKRGWLFYYPGMILMFSLVFSLSGLMSAERLPLYELLSLSLAISAASGGGNALAPGFLDKAGYYGHMMCARMIFGKGILSFYSLSLYVLLFSLAGYASGKKGRDALKLYIKKAAFTFAVFILSASALCLAFVALSGKDLSYSLYAAVSICSLCPSPLYSISAGNGIERLLVLSAVFFSRSVPPLIWELTHTGSRDDTLLPAEETEEQTALDIREAEATNG